jgi:DNA polymerase-3 subunit alpha
MSADKIYDIDRARGVYAKGVEIDVQASRAADDFSVMLARILEPFRAGRCPVWINYEGAGARARMALGREWSVNPTDELLHRLSEVAGPDGVRVIY